MKRAFGFIALAALAVMSFTHSLIDRAVDFAFNILPALVSPSAAFVVDNSHPRSPLASLRAGLA